MLKKILATALAAAMILGLASVALAASFSDTADSAKESSIKRLAGLGLLNGYPDGTFRPDNTITRAEFSKVVVYALGLKEAAEMLAGVPAGFPDVPANHWATGFISIASSQGIVNGYPDGTFKPEANVSYAEAVTMIMRALGYEPILKNGTWPTAYLTKASTLGVSKGVSFNAIAPATRANVAALVANSITKGRLVESGYFGDQIQYEVDEDSTLLALMGAEKAVGWLVSSPELFDVDDEINIILTADYGDDEVDDEVDFTLADDTEYAGLLGHAVSAWLNNDGEVFFIEDETDEDDVYVADVDEDDAIEVDDEVYDVADADYVFYNNVAQTAATFDDLADGDEVTAIFDGDTLVSVVALHYNVGIVDSVNTVYDRVTFKPSGTLRLADYDVVWSGAAAELADLEEDDVVEFITDADDEAVVIVTRNSLSGDFTRKSPADNAGVYIDGTKYTEAWGYDVPDLLGEEVTVLLNQFGKVQYMVEVEESAAEEYVAIVVDKGEDDSAWGTSTGLLKLFTAAGETLELECTADFYDDGNGDWDDLEIGDVITYELSTSGKVDTAVVEAQIVDGEADIEVNGSAKLITSSDGAFKLASGTVIFNVTDFVYLNATWEVADGADEDDLELYALSTLLDTDEITGVVVDDSGKASIVLVYDAEVEGETYYGYVTGVFEEDDAEGVIILADGVSTEYILDGDDLTGIASGDKVVFTVEGDVITDIADATIEPVDITDKTEFRVVDIDDEVVEVAQFYNEDYTVDPDLIGTKVAGSTEYLLVDDDTLFYDKTGTVKSIELADVGIDSIVQIFINADGMLAILVVID